MGFSRALFARTVTIAAAAGVAIGSSLFLAWIWRPDDPAGPCVVASGPAMLPEIPETSGLAVSRRHSGLLWSHNDSGSDAVLFAIDRAGRVHARVRVPVASRDWEDVSAGRCGVEECLYIADIGDNARTRRLVQIYRVAEPALGDSSTASPEAFTATYADGPHNAEALFVIGTDLFIVTRDRIGAVYRSRATSSDSRDLRFERVGELGLAAVTDAETSTDGVSVVVRTSHEAVLYRAEEILRGQFTPHLRIPIDGLGEPQGEGVALDGNLLYLSSEGRPWNRAGRIISLRCEFGSRESRD